MKTLLLLSQTFPPFGGAGNRRVAKITKHLAPHGWRAVVVTATRVLRNQLDESLAADVPSSTVVVRTGTLEPVRARGPHGAPLLALRRALNVPLVPSVGVLWAALAYPAALRAVRDEGVDVILASGPDFSAHVLGAALKRSTGRPLVLDYRDEWTTHFHRDERVRRRWVFRAKNELDRAVERRCLASADLVVLNTPGFTPSFTQRLGIDEKRLRVIPNGFDADELSTWTPPEPSPLRPFTLVHVGAIDEPTQLHPGLFAALRDAAKRASRQVRLVVVGNVASPLRGRLEAESRDDLVVELVGFRPAREALSLLREADAALLLQEMVEGSERYHNLKLFDYLGAKVPILALAPDPGEIADVIRRCRAGAVFDPRRLEGLPSLLQAWLTEGPRVEIDLDARAEYAWPVLGARLHGALLEALGESAVRA